MNDFTHRHFIHRERLMRKRWRIRIPYLVPQYPRFLFGLRYLGMAPKKILPIIALVLVLLALLQIAPYPLIPISVALLAVAMIL
ncbi:MAG: hypothetical protein QM796_00775 [Chthoniobacteraceae bacterium]